MRHQINSFWTIYFHNMVIQYIRSEYPKNYNISSCEKLTHRSTTKGTYADVLPTDSFVASA